jgi:uncharacterized delta-60 repeat protein
LAVCALATTALSAEPLELDDTFDGDGTAHYPIGTHGNAADIAFAATGEVLVAGTATIDGADDAVVVQVKSDGDPDPTFGTDGIVVFDTGGKERVEAVGVDADGRIVLAGSLGRKALVVRLQPDGDPDTAFGGGDGWLTWKAGAKRTAALDAVVLAGGKIVLAGRAGGATQRAFVARLTAAGAPDTSFGGGDGVALTNFGLPQARFEALTLDGKGRLVAAGQAWGAGDEDLAVARFAKDGSLDDRFGGGDGRVRVDVFRHDLGLGVTVTAQGKIAAVGSTAKPGQDTDGLIVRLLANGSRDAAFDGDGVRTVAPSNKPDAFTGVVPQGDGGLAMSGFRDGDLLVASSNPSGSVVRFRWVDHIGKLDRGVAILRLGSGKLYVGATVTTVAPAPVYEAQQLGLARFHPA